MSRFQDQGPKWDRCVMTTIKSVAVGGIVGLVLSTLVFKRKRWAFLLGVGYGVGMAYGACDYELNDKSELPPCKKESKDKQNKKEEDIWKLDPKEKNTK